MDLKKIATYPAAFLGGFASGILKLDVTDEPLKTWLEQQQINSEKQHSSDK